MNKQKLQAAADAGIISSEQVDPLFASLTETENTGSNEDEQLRFVRGFGDVFVSLGILLIAITTSKLGLLGYQYAIPVLIFFLASEWLVRVRKLVLPGIVLLLSILYFSNKIFNFEQLIGSGPYDGVFVVLISLLYYLRYKMPFALVPIALGLIWIVTALSGVDIRDVQYLFLGYGVLIFLVAMSFDARDRKRINRLSDSAFWLHLLAAPLMVHGIMSLMLMSDAVLISKEVMIIGFFVTFFLVALYVDRRAMIVSSLAYALYAIVTITKANLFNVENVTLFAFMGFGAFIVFFGAAWYSIRNIIYARFGDSWLSQYVPKFENRTS